MTGSPGCGSDGGLAGSDAAPGEDASEAICPALSQWQALGVGCNVAPGHCPPYQPLADDDGDGLSEADGDCDDSHAQVHPGAAESCDLLDDDCDGVVDGDACADAAEACPLSYADVRCCGARNTIAGAFYALRATAQNTLAGGNGFGDPWLVLVRRRDNGEQRLAVTCPAPPEVPGGFPFRFWLHDEAFVQPMVDYELFIHLRWYLPWAATPGVSCYFKAPVLRTPADTAATCVDLGPVAMPCM